MGACDVRTIAEHNQTWAVERFRDAEERIAKNRRAEEAANERLADLEEKAQQAEQYITAASSLPELAESGGSGKRRRIETRQVSRRSETRPPSRGRKEGCEI
jgi:hypothetical protein